MSRCKLQIRRAPDIGEAWGRLTVAIDNRTLFDIEAGETKAALCEPGDATIIVTASDGRGFSRRMALPPEHVLVLSLHAVAPVWWRTLLGVSRFLDFTEIARTPIGPSEPGPASQLTQQMWIGHAANEGALHALMAERDGYYSDDNAEREDTPEHMALSGFAEAMGQPSYDHDFLEYGFAKPGDDLESRFAGHSWVEAWAPVLRDTLSAEELADINVFVMFGVDRDPQFGDRRQIRQPRDLALTDIRLRYIGEINHPVRS
ncbi:immunity 22 family protein [Neorhizobium sp. JUb45]|uniref:immunity 22 family protein n=1 Tax=unclassified Neorhizobium TaxID=2629175 RepID=UPI001049AE00|nr:immunity 22 family protein [Neorhizobium sp. JUb45]TCR06363.1 immunity protein 22 of polymorphic toxin system [Neorhizobium sp. JUb45]